MYNCISSLNEDDFEYIHKKEVFNKVCDYLLNTKICEEDVIISYSYKFLQQIQTNRIKNIKNNKNIQSSLNDMNNKYEDVVKVKNLINSKIYE